MPCSGSSVYNTDAIITFVHCSYTLIDKSDQKFMINKKINFCYSYIVTEYLHGSSSSLVAMVAGIDAMILSIHYFECYCSGGGSSSSLLRISCSPDGRLKHGSYSILLQRCNHINQLRYQLVKLNALSQQLVLESFLQSHRQSSRWRCHSAGDKCLSITIYRERLLHLEDRCILRT